MIPRSSKAAKKFAPTTSHKAFIDSGAAVHTVKDALAFTRKAGPFSINIGTDNKDRTSTMAHVQSVFKLSGREKPATRGCVLHVTSVEHSLTLVSILCDDDHMVEFTKHRCVV